MTAPDPIAALAEVTGFVQAMAPHEEHFVWDALDVVEAALRDRDAALRAMAEENERLRKALGSAVTWPVDEALRRYSERAAIPGSAGVILNNGHAWEPDGVGNDWCLLCGETMTAFSMPEGPCSGALAPSHDHGGG